MSTFNLNEENNDEKNQTLTPIDIDTIGEIGNISIGTSATTLSSILNHKVTITTPKVELTDWETISDDFSMPCLITKVEYLSGLNGSNLLVLKQSDAKIISNLMMGGDGKIEDENELLNELDISAVGEAMNQMIGSSSNSLFFIFNRKIDISPPQSSVINFKNQKDAQYYDIDEKLLKVEFKMVIDNLLDSVIMQIIPISFAREMIDLLHNVDNGDKQENVISKNSDKKETKKKATPNKQTIVKPAVFEQFTTTEDDNNKENGNLEILMDIPLKVTVELGHTYRDIHDIMNLSYNSIIELDKKTGEPLNVYANGSLIAKGEVILVDENIGVKIVELSSKNRVGDN